MGLTPPRKVHTILISIHLFVMGIRLPQKFSAFLQTRWVALLNLGLLVLLCWQLAHWTWLFLAPVPAKPVAAASTTPDTVRLLDTIRAAHLFGSADQAAGPTATQTTTALNLKLSGVFASNGKHSALAIINVENKGNLPFMRGDTILPGVTLEQVRPDHVVLNRGGMMEKLPLEQKGLPLALQKTTRPLNVHREGKDKFSIPRDELDQVLSDPGQLANAGSLKPVPGQGVRVEKAGSGSLISQLGLQGGDLIRQVNGKPVAQVADLLQSYRADGQIKLEGTRNGQPFEYNYSVR